MRKCSACQEEKPLSDFDRRLKGWAYKCKPCARAYSKAHYQAQPQYYKDKSNTRKRGLKRWVDEMKESGQCTDCGNRFPACAMDYDHLEDKSFNIAEAINRQYPRSKIEAEIAKCELVCACCHRIRTWQRAQAVGEVY